MIDWITALAQQDKSMEGILARQNMAPYLEQLQQVEATKQRKAIADAELAQREQERQAEIAARKLAQEKLDEERKTDNKRNRYSIIHGNLKPGDRMRRGPDFDLMNEFGTGQQFEADPTNPDEFIFRKHEYETAQQQLKQQNELRQAQEKRAARDQALQEKADKRADAEEQRRIKREERAAQAAETKRKQAEVAMKDIPVSLRPGVKARAEEIFKEKSSVLEFLPGFDKSITESDAWIEAANEIKKKAQDAGLMPITAPGPGAGTGGRGGGAGAGAPPPAASGGYRVLGEVKPGG